MIIIQIIKQLQPSIVMPFFFFFNQLTVQTSNTTATIEIASFKRKVQIETAMGVQKPREQNNYLFEGNKYLAVTCSVTLREKADM